MNFKNPCNISNYRCNSRRIYCLKVFILNLDRTEIMIEASLWEHLEYCLRPVISPKYPKPYCCLMKHWNKTIQFMDISFTNEISERSFGLINNVVPTCKNFKTLENRV
ncbi:hypothetical protein A3Q56_07453 [Intoshia linei]|uniref:Uncharacterized protein n=1 Tax=Intoshia linei TaxID=1819745 RepID=A0A177AS65_9BILA|nr:hypothetical protein A3Q56_07453 [Intoshia linei]